MSQIKCLLVAVLLTAAAARPARGDFLTETWGNAPSCRHRNTVQYADRVLTFDLSALEPGTKVHRAIFKPTVRRRGYSGTIDFRAVLKRPETGGDEPALGEPLALRAPLYDSFDATELVRRWVAQPGANLGLYVKWAPGVRAGNVVLEISYEGESDRPIPKVAGLKALHQAGQTFLTWKEIEDPVGADAPTFEQFHNAVMAARKKRSIVYRVYRSDRPIAAASLGEAELVREVPEIITCWNLKAVNNTEHPNQGTPTMHSPLRPGYNNARNHIMTRYLITDPGEPLPRATGLAVITVTEPGKRYYAVTAAIDGAEAVLELDSVGPVEEQTSKFPAIIFQRSIGELGERSSRVDVCNSWIGPPYHNVPTEAETYIMNWYDQPRGTAEKPIPLWVVCGTYGSTAATMQHPGWYHARKHLTGAFTVGLAEGGLWQGFHECLGTLRSYDQGVVHNYPQRRVLGAAAWAMWKKDFFIDPERVYFWAQLGSWALRHGDVFAVVMSNGYGNFAVGKEAQKHASKWGPGALGSDNWLGVPQWEYMNVAKWVRENPTTELPYWVCWPAYGAYPSHTVGDFGFMPWPEMMHAMHSTKRAFAAVWNSNGPGAIRPLLPIVTRIRRSESLPAFARCSLDASPGDGDHADAQKSGGINLYQMWDPETITDEADRWEITLYLRKDCPAEMCVTDLTPRRCRKFKAKPGEKFTWTCRPAAGGPVGQTGTAEADQWGLVTVKALKIAAGKTRLCIQKSAGPQ